MCIEKGRKLDNFKYKQIKIVEISGNTYIYIYIDSFRKIKALTASVVCPVQRKRINLATDNVSNKTFLTNNKFSN